MADDKYIFGVLGALLVLIVTLILTGALLLATTVDALADDCQARAEAATDLWFGYPSADWTFAADVRRRKRILDASGGEWDPPEVEQLYFDLCKEAQSHFVARTY